jgi:hypothetical protein
MHRFTTNNVSRNERHAELVTEPEKVAWPNSRVLIEATTRDGQAIEPRALVVEGLRTQNVSPLSATTLRPENLQVSGRLLPSARAWIKTDNVFVSEPAYHRALVTEGHELLEQAQGKEARISDIAQLLQIENQKRNRDPTKLNEWNQELQALRREVPQLRKAGEDKIARGEKLMVSVVATGGVPAAADVTTVNRREAGERDQGTIHTAQSQSEAIHGFLAHEVEALRGDEIAMRVDFGRTGDSLTSQAEIRFNVPSGGKPAFEMDGIKYYRISPTFERATHDPDPVQPE